jgi:hypothetical protein
VARSGLIDRSATGRNTRTRTIEANRVRINRAWSGVASALAQSDKWEDRDLARHVLEFVNTMPLERERAILAQGSRAPVERGLER